MEVKFADSFGDSIKKLIMHESWWYKIYETVRYKIPVFFKNIYRFRKVLWNHRWWDYRYTLEALQTSLEIMENKMHDGMEVFESRGKKIEKMQRAIQILKNIGEDSYIAMAEAELGELYQRDWEFEEVPDKPGFSRLVDNETPAEKKHNRKVFNRSRQIEEQEWKELFTILEGQNHAEFKKIVKKATEEEKKSQDLWNNWYNGTGLKGWWD